MAHTVYAGGSRTSPFLFFFFYWETLCKRGISVFRQSVAIFASDTHTPCLPIPPLHSNTTHTHTYPCLSIPPRLLLAPPPPQAAARLLLPACHADHGGGVTSSPFPIHGKSFSEKEPWNLRSLHPLLGRVDEAILAVSQLEVIDSFIRPLFSSYFS